VVKFLIHRPIAEIMSYVAIIGLCLYCFVQNTGLSKAQIEITPDFDLPQNQNLSTIILKK